jgi:hypothetical protein
VVKGFRKLTRTILVLLTQLPCKGVNIFASVAGGLHERGRYAAERGKIVDWVCRMPCSFSDMHSPKTHSRKHK